MRVKIPGDKVVEISPNSGASAPIPGKYPLQIIKPNIRWLLRDEFTSAAEAGSIPTAAEPGPGTRTVVDTESKLAINASGQLAFAGGKAAPALGDPTLYYPVVSQVAGQMLICEVTASDLGTTGILFGYDGAAGGTVSPASIGLGGTNLSVRLATSTTVVGAIATGISYKLACILRSTGVFYYIKGGAFTNWTLLGIDNTVSDNSLYPSLMNYNAIFTSSFLRIPQALWLPVPLLSTSGAMTWPTTNGLGHAEGVAGGLGAGGSGLTILDMGSWSVAGGYMLNTPVVGVEVLEDTGFDDAGKWTCSPGWTVAGSVATSVHAANITIYQTKMVTGYVGKWFKVSVDCKTLTAGAYTLEVDGGSAWATINSTGVKTYTGRYITHNANRPLLRTSSFDGTIDDFTTKPLPISSLITSVQLVTTDVLAEAVIHAYTLGSQVGIVQLDRPFAFLANANAAAGQAVIVLKGVTNAIPDTDTITIKHPIAGGTTYTIASVSALAGGIQTLTLDVNLVEAVSENDEVGVDWASWNGVLCYFDGVGNIKTDEIKAGVYTNRESTATAFSADKRLIIRKIGTEYRSFYNEALLVAETAVDAASQTGLYWGLFSTLADNQVTSFTVFDTGNVTALYNSTLDKYSKD